MITIIKLDSEFDFKLSGYIRICLCSDQWGFEVKTRPILIIFEQ